MMQVIKTLPRHFKTFFKSLLNSFKRELAKKSPAYIYQKRQIYKNRKNKETLDKRMEFYNSILVAINDIAARRVSMNKFFLTMHAVILSAFGYAIKLFHGRIHLVIKILAVLVLLYIVYACLLWIINIKNYANLGVSLLNILRTLEEDLPEEPMNLLLSTLNHFGYSFPDLSIQEQSLPIIFIILYCIAYIVFAFG